MSMYDDINAGKYHSKLPFPSRPDKPKLLRMTVEKLSSEDVSSIRAVRESYEASTRTVEESRRAYREDEQRLYCLFKQDALADCGLTNHPKADAIFSRAWDRGHSSGYSEVYSELCDLAELFQ